MSATSKHILSGSLFPILHALLFAALFGLTICIGPTTESRTDAR